MLTILSTENLMRNWQVSVVSSAFEMNRFRDLYNSDIKFVYYKSNLEHKLSFAEAFLDEIRVI